MSGGFKHHQILVSWGSVVTLQQNLIFTPLCIKSYLGTAVTPTTTSFLLWLNFEFCIYPKCWEFCGMFSERRGRFVWESGYPSLKYTQLGQSCPKEQGRGTGSVLWVSCVRFPWYKCGFSQRNGRRAWTLPCSLCQ